MFRTPFMKMFITLCLKYASFNKYINLKFNYLCLKKIQLFESYCNRICIFARKISKLTII